MLTPRERFVIRSQVLTAHAEEMVALIRFHVAQCPRCKEELCAEGMPELVKRLDAELKELRVQLQEP